jgi:hypothetical protein
MAYSDLPKLAAVSFKSMSKEEGEAAAAELVTHSGPSFATPLTHAGFKDVKVFWLLCEDDLAIPPEIQRGRIAMIEQESGNKVDVTVIDADHVASWSAPQLVIDWILGVVERLDRAQMKWAVTD